ncbi:multidrug transporter MatE [Clostridium novyi B str. ATCC 27606]|uniref:Probable multidrug resistance protein NorM n=3 Tax=Clostridium TaxID=1485 RepID=A0AA40ISU7_CLONO|nr:MULTISPECIES: MATE family efflux transporter [Clostridium]KEI14214.1 multidrug transporter MatE [Clostridium novyi B str. ATCC 27606]KEI14576.1 multidrug transporter MatE [Clostridium novyi B str. NCTC 9691]KEI16043.1 multidrug transporter MatE [Clostridium haemolyticum NCTC 9693]KGN03650.1 multidrug transporter MatE [Clostridium haemolyticum NCTC 8350]OOB76131.1 MATE family efflux transporter [Clostridium haemolyticum]
MKNQLTKGKIFPALIKLAIPIMGTSFVQMAYNMTDMIYIGRMGSSAVAAIGTAGFFTWFAMGLILISRTGAEIGVSQSIGREDIRSAKKYAKNTIILNILLALIYGSFLIIFRRQLIGFFNLGNENVIDMAINYLVIIAIGINFYFINPVFTGIYNGSGDSKTPFRFNVVGLASNMILDPVLIFGIGPFPALGVRGAAIATVFSQIVVSVLFILSVRKSILIRGFSFKDFDFEYMKNIFKFGFPVAMQNALFCVFSMIIARIISVWGNVAIAVQKVGSQIESISWMTAGGFQTAISTFVGQNYGAKKWDRIIDGYKAAVIIVGTIGVFATCLLIFGAEPIFSFFIPEKSTIPYGVDYLKILGISQFFMCMEIATAGAFNGMGKTVPPAIVGIVFTGLRIPSALMVSKYLGLNGVWWCISISSIIKGIVLTSCFLIYLTIRKKKV